MKYFGLILLSLIIVLVIVVACFATVNVRRMNNCIDEAMTLIGENVNLKEVSAGEFATMRVNGIMKFHVRQFEMEDTGNLSIMTVNVGLMQMATLVFTPLSKGLPLLSCDLLYILGNRKSYLELYDLVKEKDDTYTKWLSLYDGMRSEYTDLEDFEASKAWYEHLISIASYKAGKTGNDKRLKGIMLDYVKIYMNQVKSYPALDEAERSEKAARVKEYSDKLIDEGGVSTSFFKKSLGEDTTREFFDKVFFGTQR